MRTFGVFLTLVAFANACCQDDTCSCEPNCWEQCFMNPPDIQEYRQAYMKIYHMALGIRNLYAPCFKPHGTAYMMDSDVPINTATSLSPSTIFMYQRNLASIVGMTQPVGNDCNPFCASKFYRNFAWYSHAWPCKDRCEIYDFFQTGSMTSFSSTSASPTIPSWVGGGQILADLCFDRDNLGGHECMNCTNNELLLAFTNSMMYWTPPSERCGVDYYCAAIGTDPSAIHGNMAGWTNSGPVYHMPATNVYISSALRINRCINYSCCRQQLPNNWWNHTPFKGRELTDDEFDKEFTPEELQKIAEATSEQSESQTTTDEAFFYTDPKSGKKVKTFKGTQDEFDKLVNTNVNSGVSIAPSKTISPSRG